jgi:hypothetical protein
VDIKIKLFPFLPKMIDLIFIRIYTEYKFVINKALFNLNMLSSLDETFFENGI